MSLAPWLYEKVEHRDKILYNPNFYKLRNMNG